MALYTIDVVVQDTRKDDQLASLRFLRERIRPTRIARGDVNTETEPTAWSITTPMSAGDASDIPENMLLHMDCLIWCR